MLISLMGADKHIAGRYGVRREFGVPRTDAPGLDGKCGHIRMHVKRKQVTM